MSYIIGSFNLQNLSENTAVKRSKDFKEIARIIRKEKFDIIALQEVLSEMAIEQLVQSLGRNKWESVFLQPESYGGKSEGYAYIWNKNRIKLVEDDNNPMIYNKHRTVHQFGTRGQGLVRPPLVARFEPAERATPFIEFRLINTHITFGKSKNYTGDLDDKELRRKEYEILTQDVYRLISTKGYGNNRTSFTILLGDYNLCLTSNGPKIDSTVKVSLAYNKSLVTVQDKKTTLKMKNEAGDEYFANDYDHFTFDECYLEKTFIKYDRVNAVEHFHNNDIELYRTKISDHVPIKLLIDFKTRGRRVIPWNIQESN